jgi:hypothetical protein
MSRGRKRVEVEVTSPLVHLTIRLLDTQEEYLVLGSTIMAPEGLKVLVSKGENASNRKQSHGLVKLETDMAGSPFWFPHTTEPVGREVGYSTDWDS